MRGTQARKGACLVVEGLEGYLAHKKQPHLGPYGRPVPRAIGGGAVSYERGTPVEREEVCVLRIEPDMATMYSFP